MARLSTADLHLISLQGRVDMTEAALPILLTLITHLPPPKYFKVSFYSFRFGNGEMLNN